MHELGLDRVIAFGHTWSPTLELTPRIPLRHGHAITVSQYSVACVAFSDGSDTPASQIDMAYSITLAHVRGLIADSQRDEWFGLVSAVGLSMDHEAFNDELIGIATESIECVADWR